MEEKYFNGFYDNLQNKNQEASLNTKYPKSPVTAAVLQTGTFTSGCLSPFCPFGTEKNKLRDKRLMRELCVLKY